MYPTASRRTLSVLMKRVYLIALRRTLSVLMKRVYPIAQVPNIFPNDERQALMETCRLCSIKKGLKLESAVSFVLFAM